MSHRLFEPGTPTQVLFDAMSALVFIVDEQMRVVDANQAATRALGTDAEFAMRRLCGEVLHCLNSGRIHPESPEPGPCGTSAGCTNCSLRSTTTLAMNGQTTMPHPYVMRLLVGRDLREAHFLVTGTAFAMDGTRLVMLILDDVTELEELRRVIPVCAWCKRVRDDEGYRQSLEAYLRRHTSLEITHSICPECYRNRFPGIPLPGEDPAVR